ncbi:MAG: hypothetical protein ACJASS_002052 [Sulfitobacter sp.]|jgi:hypothetical protein
MAQTTYPNPMLFKHNSDLTIFAVSQGCVLRVSHEGVQKASLKMTHSHPLCELYIFRHLIGPSATSMHWQAL